MTLKLRFLFRLLLTTVTTCLVSVYLWSPTTTHCVGTYR